MIGFKRFYYLNIAFRSWKIAKGVVFQQHQSLFSVRKRIIIGGNFKPLTSSELAHKIADLALEKKAEDVVLLDLRSISGFTDFFVICSGTANTHVKAICEYIEDHLQTLGIRPYSLEGMDSLRWALLDYVDVVVHVFLPEGRDFYGLERLWGDATVEMIGN